MVGLVAGFLHGSAFPVAMFIFGDITNAFIDREATAAIFSTIGGAPCPIDPTNITRSCDIFFPFPDSSGLCALFSINQLLSAVAGANVTCLTDDLFIDEVNRLVYIFIGIAVGAFVFATFQNWSFRLAAERQVYKIRMSYYRAVLQQEQGWFDLNSTGTLSNHLTR